MNLLKGNINFTNELIDVCKTKEELRDNETLIELMKSLKEVEEKLFTLIGDSGNLNEDVFNIVLMVNEDLQSTFLRFKQIKEGREA